MLRAVCPPARASNPSARYWHGGLTAIRVLSEDTGQVGTHLTLPPVLAVAVSLGEGE